MKVILLIVTLVFNTIAYAEQESSLNVREREQVEELVQKAKKYVETYGKEHAMIEFNKKIGEFSEKSSYIFALDYDSTYLATINYPNLVGINQFDLKDPHRTFLVQEEIEKAKSGGGWIKTARLKKNPATNKIECKESYILPMPGDYLIGSGFYYSPDKDGKC